jgi:peptidoglycan hydrolase-like protein with peptidoglycan-binding domain
MFSFKPVHRRTLILGGLLLPFTMQPALAGLEGRRRKDGQSHSSNVVRAVQAQLASLGYDPQGVDGKIGPNTRAAIQRYQQDNNLPATGQIDDALLVSLGLASAPDG